MFERNKEDERKNLRVLVTAGPTREYIDPVRYISNDSSGKMGFALASAAVKLGAKVTLITGPVTLDTPEGARRIDIVTAGEMFAEVKRHAGKADIIIMAAAVADWRPVQFSKTKIKRKNELTDGRTNGRADRFTIELKENPDILAWLGETKRKGQILAGFALETANLIRNAKKKLTRKNCDWIVANRVHNTGRDKGNIVMISKRDKISLINLPKDDLAVIIMSYLYNQTG